MQSYLNQAITVYYFTKNGKRLVENREPNCTITKETEKAVFIQKA